MAIEEVSGQGGKTFSEFCRVFSLDFIVTSFENLEVGCRQDRIRGSVQKSFYIVGPYSEFCIELDQQKRKLI
ncbi:hypothetical protein [Grimontia hollisae]|uniref:hypothetical protein n=1 Tax=Grimontia hollisae TaxID=673 RepID=UPI00165E799A|nr:hypothetical protein [Grimontia hollisae]